ncbi:heavy-metal-associated domain-containing protein [Tunturiibacter empetritectus]|uniref:Copper chaperone CopZ n=1 Tax=Tunturiibacter lichenicola TaxID=2051959 RepID=A0A852VI76_9BACT|nr:heavy-metal-associated domain-containing protein [Edaphobacter lichenicola]NYF90154.1 copper chaperone CopZ [Edaphobacter lichenicola]
MKIAIAGILGMCALTAQGQYKQINLTVFGMDCPPCAFAIRLSMKNVRGVSGVDVDLNKGLVAIKLTAGSTAELRQFNEAGKRTASHIKMQMCLLRVFYQARRKRRSCR